MTTPLRPRPFAAAVLGLAVLAGCAAGVPATVTPTDGQSPAATPSSPTPAPTSAPPAATASPSTGLSLPHDDPDLEALLPDEVDGATLVKLSVGPISSAGNAGAEPVRALANEIGDGTGNFSLAFANDPSSPTFNLFALRIPGADSTELLERYTALTIADAAGSTTDQLTLAGKTVVTVVAPNNPIGPVWFYAVDDTIFGVQAADEATAAELLALLP